jgi:hypothetical protein
MNNNPLKMNGYGLIAGSRQVTGLMTGILGVCGTWYAGAQESLDYLEPYRPLSLQEYDLKFNDLMMDLVFQTGASFTDNLGFEESAQAGDFSLSAGMNLRTFYQPRSDFALNLNMFLGYQHFFEYSELNTLLIQPGSEFRVERKLGDFKLGVYDQIGVEMNPLTRPFVSGDAATLGGAETLEWRRLRNMVGVALTWQPTRYFHSLSAYEFDIDRTLTDTFVTLDRNRHIFRTGGYYDFSRQLNVGLEGQYSITNFTEDSLPGSQNDSDSVEVGPRVIIRPTQTTDLNLKVAYNTIDFDQTGQITDIENFEGVSFDARFNWQQTRNLTHSVYGRRFISDGFGTNFADQKQIGYRLSSQLSQTLQATLDTSYMWLSTSGGALSEDATLLLTSVSLSKSLNRKSTLGLTYSFNYKDSEINLRDFQQNLVILNFSYDL